MVDNNLLQHWRDYQPYKRKLKMAEMALINQFPCALISINLRYSAVLIINEEDRRIDVRLTSLIRPRLESIMKIPIADIRGYNEDQADRTITFTLLEQLEEDLIILEFGDPLTLEAAFAAIQSFLK